MHGILKLQSKVQGHPDSGWRVRYQALGTEEWPHPRAAGEGDELPTLPRIEVAPAGDA